MPRVSIPSKQTLPEVQGEEEIVERLLREYAAEPAQVRADVAEFLDRDYNIGEVRQNVYERTLRAIRRISGKEPMVLPLLIEID